MDEKIIKRLEELDLTDKEIVLINYWYENGDITEEEIFDIGDEDFFDIENIDNYDLAITISEDSDAYGDIISCGREEWYVFDDKQDAIDAAVEDTKYLLDDIGIDGIKFDVIGGIENFVNTEWFEDAERESFEFYCDDIVTEGSMVYDNRLVEECYDEGLISDDDFEVDEDGDPDYTQCKVSTDDLKEKYTDYHMEQIDDFVQSYIWNFGKEDFNRVVKDNNLVDLDKLAEAIVEADGPANSLARWDGEEVTSDFNGNTYYMYRNN